MNKPQQIRIAALPPFPNSAYPVLLHEGAIEQSEVDARAFESLFARNGWQGIWVNGVYGFDHFHAHAHEALGVARGWVRVRLGGPQGQEVTLNAGDAVILPAGVGHRRMAASADFSIVGAYPPGQSPDMQRGDPAAYEALARQAQQVPVPASDPVTGEPMAWAEE
ncbi:MAG: cupin domain-containing protein [Clostridiales bacterium]|nr:cupin domain-containing protein [Clostridiales bacterium]